MATVVSAAWSFDLYVNILFVYYLVHPVSLGITLLLFQVEDLGTMLENVLLTITYPLLINVLNVNGLGLIWSFVTHDMPLAGTNKSVGYIYLQHQVQPSDCPLNDCVYVFFKCGNYVVHFHGNFPGFLPLVTLVIPPTSLLSTDRLPDHILSSGLALILVYCSCKAVMLPSLGPLHY